MRIHHRSHSKNSKGSTSTSPKTTSRGIVLLNAIKFKKRIGMAIFPRTLTAEKNRKNGDVEDLEFWMSFSFPGDFQLPAVGFSGSIVFTRCSLAFRQRRAA